MGGSGSIGGCWGRERGREGAGGARSDVSRSCLCHCSFEPSPGTAWNWLRGARFRHTCHVRKSQRQLFEHHPDANAFACGRAQVGALTTKAAHEEGRTSLSRRACVTRSGVARLHGTKGSRPNRQICWSSCADVSLHCRNATRVPLAAQRLRRPRLRRQLRRRRQLRYPSGSCPCPKRAVGVW